MLTRTRGRPQTVAHFDPSDLRRFLNRGSPRHDPQRELVYNWERAFLPNEDRPRVDPKHPFTDDFLAFYREAWAYGFAKYASGCDPQFITATPPELQFSPRLRSAAGKGGIGLTRGKLQAAITFGQYGPTHQTLLHEIAHCLTPRSEYHGPLFCAVALDLYAKFLGVYLTEALHHAYLRGVKIANVEGLDAFKASWTFVLAKVAARGAP